MVGGRRESHFQPTKDGKDQHAVRRIFEVDKLQDSMGVA